MKYKITSFTEQELAVAPARERGLKSPMLNLLIVGILRRSREGAWIEIAVDMPNFDAEERRSREGAWIEIR